MRRCVSLTLGTLGRAPNAPLDWFCRVVLRAMLGRLRYLAWWPCLSYVLRLHGSCNCVHALVRVSVWRGTGTTGCVPCK